MKNIKIPQLIIHGENDNSVLLSEGKKINKWNPKSELKIIKKANHVFNTSHPWEHKSLPKEFEKVIKTCISFLN